MLEALEIRNFKALHSLKLKNLKKINIFIGQNSAGKSSVLQAIAFLAQSTGSEITYKGSMVDLGSFDNTVFGHYKSRSIIIGLSYSLPKIDNISTLGVNSRIKRLEEEKKISLKGDVNFEVSVDNNGIFCQKIDYENFKLSIIFSRDPNLSLNIRILPKINGLPYELYGKDAKTLLGATIGDRSKRERIVHPQGFADAIRLKNKQLEFEENIGDSTKNEVEKELANILIRILKNNLRATHYFSTSRAIKDWQQDLKETMSFGTESQDAISMLHQIYSNQPEVFGRIAIWIEKLGLGRLYSTTKGPTSSILLSDPLLNVKSNIVSSGFGINQLISVIGGCIASAKGSTIMIEEPEISLHPGAIGILADLFLETLDSRQLFISTHSDRLILEIWARVKLGLLDCSDVGLFLINKTQSGVTAKEIKLDRHVADIQKDLKVLYEPKSPLDELLKTADESGEKNLSKKDFSEL